MSSSTSVESKLLPQKKTIEVINLTLSPTDINWWTTNHKSISAKHLLCPNKEFWSTSNSQRWHASKPNITANPKSSKPLSWIVTGSHYQYQSISNIVIPNGTVIITNRWSLTTARQIPPMVKHEVTQYTELIEVNNVNHHYFRIILFQYNYQINFTHTPLISYHNTSISQPTHNSIKQTHTHTHKYPHVYILQFAMFANLMDKLNFISSIFTWLITSIDPKVNLSNNQLHHYTTTHYHFTYTYKQI